MNVHPFSGSYVAEILTQIIHIIYIAILAWAKHRIEFKSNLISGFEKTLKKFICKQ